MNLSDYMGGRCLWKFNSMGVGVKNISPTRYFFQKLVDFHLSQWIFYIKLNFACDKNTYVLTLPFSRNA